MEKESERERGSAFGAPLTILLTGFRASQFTGSECSLRDLACGLVRLGHRTWVYSPELGPLADELRAGGALVVDDLARLPGAPDLVHGIHYVPAMQAMLRFPRVPALFVCHGRVPWEEVPPLWEGVRRYVAVDLNTRERLVRGYGIREASIDLMLNCVDTGRFGVRPPLPPAPRRALVFSNYAGPNTHLEAVEAACRAVGLDLDVIGLGVGKALARPERELCAYDLVFAKARCALEAMATGAAVILCDTRGLGPRVTRANVEEPRPWNFGMRCLTRPLSPALIADEIRGYDPADATAVCHYVREAASLARGLEDWLAVYRAVLAEPPRPGAGEPSMAAFLEATARRLAEFERAAGGLEEFRGMEALPEGFGRWLDLEVDEAPAQAVAAAAFQVRVRLTNRSGLALRSTPPHPIELSYRWEDPISGARIVPEGARTRLFAPLAAGVGGLYSVWVEAPRFSRFARWLRSSPRSLRLVVTLVQNGIRWLDEDEPPVSVELPVTVGVAP